jgi:hypothetical protein
LRQTASRPVYRREQCAIDGYINRLFPRGGDGAQPRQAALNAQACVDNFPVEIVLMAHGKFPDRILFTHHIQLIAAKEIVRTALRYAQIGGRFLLSGMRKQAAGSL